MRTLDEVIKALEICINNQRCIDGCPYYKNDCPQYEMEKDALHYLRIFQAHEQRVRDQLDALKDEYRPNDPLTWQELQGMARKPVWIEWKNPRRIPRWWIVDLNEKPDPNDGLLGICTSGTRFECLVRREQGIEWNAYRKERV